MSEALVFGNLHKIKFDTKIHRKDFIDDMVVICIALSILFVVTSEKLEASGNVNALHKNKNRKSIKKIKNIYEELAKKRSFIYSILEEKELKLIQYKIKKTSTAFIEIISMTESDVSLEFIAVNILHIGLERNGNKNRRTNLHQRLTPFSNTKTIFGGIAKVVEDAGISISCEYDIAKNFIEKINK